MSKDMAQKLQPARRCRKIVSKSATTMEAAQQNTWGRIGRALIKDHASLKDLVANAGTSHQNVTPVIRSKSAHSHEKGGDSNAKDEN